jgi:hypothetical protein
LLQAIQQSLPEKPGKGCISNLKNPIYRTFHGVGSVSVITTRAVMPDLPILAISGLVSAELNSFRQRLFVCRYPAWI